MRTMQGLAVPKHIDAPRVSGRYAIRAPEAQVGSILRVRDRIGSTHIVQVTCPHGRRLFVDIAGNLVDFVSWDFAPLADVRAFLWDRQLGEWADGVELHGVLGLQRAIAGMERLERDDAIKAVADELRLRGKPHKASAVLSMRWEGDE